jgi:uncharacterized protein YbcI
LPEIGTYDDIASRHGCGRRDGASLAPEESFFEMTDMKAPFEGGMRTRGEMEASICEGISRFQQEFLGRGPKEIRAYLLGDLVVVRMQGVLTAAEQHLVQTLIPEKGRDLLKQVRTQLIELARPTLTTMIRDATGVPAISLHHDISTVTGEEVILFTLSGVPAVRESTKK